MTKEVLSSIRFIKFMAFEPAYEKRVLVAREVELKALRKNQNIGILINTLGVVGPALSLLVSFGCYTLLAGRTLLPSSAFSAALIMEQIRNCLDVGLAVVGLSHCLSDAPILPRASRPLPSTSSKLETH